MAVVVHVVEVGAVAAEAVVVVHLELVDGGLAVAVVDPEANLGLHGEEGRGSIARESPRRSPQARAQSRVRRRSPMSRKIW